MLPTVPEIELLATGYTTTGEIIIGGTFLPFYGPVPSTALSALSS